MPAESPVPGDGTVMVDPVQVLSWESGRFAASHDVHFGTETPPPFIGNYLENTFSPPEMERGTIYFWRIDEVNAKGTTAGPVWSFTTDSTPAAGNREVLSASLLDPLIHPNPANHYIRVNVPESKEMMDFLIHDASGKLIKRVQVNTENHTEQKIKITTDELPAGMYHLNIYSAKGGVGHGANLSGRFIIVR